jgi:hypothetical protein
MTYMNTYILKTIKSVSFMLMLFLVGGLVFLSSCQKEDPTAPLEATAPPVIERIRLIDPAKADSSLQSSTLGTSIVIVGQNLAATQHVSFNGLVTPINPVYATETHLIVTIPSNTPTVATAASVPNELKVVNAKGEATLPFQVLPPAPEVTSIQTEYVKEGDQLTLNGMYFFFVEGVTFPGGVVVPGSEVTTSPDGSTLSVTVPAGVDFSQGRDVIVKTQSGTSVAGRNTKIYGSQGMVVDWDTRTSWNPDAVLNSTWGISEKMENVTTTFPGITPVSGQFGVVDMPIPGGWGWANAKLVNIGNNDSTAENGGKPYPVAPAAHYGPEEALGNFDLKFEIASTKPVGELLAQVWQSNGGKDYTVQVPLKNFVMSADGQWYTVTINLGDLANEDVKLSKLKDFTGPKEFRVLIQNPTDADIPATLAIDNIRIVNHTK